MTQMRMVRCVCRARSPFRVEIDGATMDARAIAGQTWTVGETGTALWAAPGMPLCLKTTTSA